MFSVKVASIIKKTESFFLVWHKEASLRTLNRWEVVSTPRKEGLGFWGLCETELPSEEGFGDSWSGI